MTAPLNTASLVSSWREAMEGVTPGPWVYIKPVEFDGDDENEPGGFIHPGSVEGDDGNPVCAFGDPSGSGTMFENTADHHWLARCSPSGISALLDALESTSRALSEKGVLIDRLRMEAQIHAGEARCHKATVHEAYQACSGATGEPGNWHGAEPIRKALSEVTRQRDEALAALKGCQRALAMMIAPDAIKQTTVINAYANAVAAEATARSVLENGSATLADATKKDPGTEQREAGE